MAAWRYSMVGTHESTPNSYGAIIKSDKFPLTIVAKPIGGEVVPESGTRALFSFDAGTGSVLLTYSTEKSTSETLS